MSIAIAKEVEALIQTQMCIPFDVTEQIVRTVIHTCPNPIGPFMAKYTLVGTVETYGSYPSSSPTTYCYVITYEQYQNENIKFCPNCGVQLPHLIDIESERLV